MIKRIFAALLALCSAVAFGQSTPGFSYGQIPTVDQWNSYFAAKLDVYAGGLPVTLGGTGSTTAGGALSSLGIPTGTSGHVIPYLDGANTWSGVQTLTSPVLITPTLGVAGATSINKVTITAPATGSTLTIANGKTLAANNSVTLAGTDGTTYTLPSQSASAIPYVGADTLANIIANWPAASYSGYRARATDVGVAPGMLLVSDGAKWVPDGVQTFARITIAFAPAPTGTMANNGAVTLGTALPLTYTQGLYLYFPAGAIAAASSAGWYWTVMSTPTVGTVKNNTYTSGVPTIPTSPTPFVTTGPGAFTGSTTEITGPNLTVPGNLLGTQGSMQKLSYWDTTSSANTKNVKWTLGGSLISQFSASNVVGNSFLWTFSNDNSTSAQITNNSSYGAGANFSAVVRQSVDTSTNQVMAITFTRATATEIMMLDRAIFTILP